MFLLTFNRMNMGKSIMMITAIAASIALTITMLSLGNGIRTSTRETLEDIGADAYVVVQDLNPLLMDLQKFDQGGDIISEFEKSPSPPSEYSPRLRDSLFFDHNGIKGEVVIFGIIPGRERYFGQFVPERDEWFHVLGDPVRETFRTNGISDPDLLTGELMISVEFARENDIVLGDEIDVTTTFRGGTSYTYKVVGFFEDILTRKAPEVLIHLGELQYMKGWMEKDTLTEILLHFDSDEDMRMLISWSEGESFRYRDVVDVHTKETVLSEVYRFTDIVNGFSALVIAVTVTVSLVFISTLLMISTKQRNRDFAILRTLGFSRAKVFILLLRESVMISLMGSVAGLILGFLLIVALNSVVDVYFNALPSSFVIFLPAPFTILISLGIYLSTGLLAGLVPSIITSMKPPVEQLRGEAG